MSKNKIKSLRLGTGLFYPYFTIWRISTNNCKSNTYKINHSGNNLNYLRLKRCMNMIDRLCRKQSEELFEKLNTLPQNED